MHSNRVSKIDKEFAKKLESELNYNFDDVKIEDLSKIEDLLETNIYVYSCNKNLKEKIPNFKSDKQHEKYIDLLLFENHYILIKILIDSFTQMLKINHIFVEVVVVPSFQKRSTMNICNFVIQIKQWF